MDRMTPAMERLSSALVAASAQNAAAAECSELRAALREASRACMCVRRDFFSSVQVANLRALVRTATAFGAAEVGLTGQDVAEARAVVEQGLHGLLAAMLLAPAWELPAAPRSSRVPDWLWGEYTAWLFAPPRDFISADSAARLAALRLPHLEDLHQWTVRNPGSTTVRAALEAYATVPPTWRGAGAVSQRAANLRGQILARFYAAGQDRWFEPLIRPRDGRQLRVGFVARDFGSGPDVFAALACLEKLDTTGFEVFIFAFAEPDTPEARHCATFAKGLFRLPDDSEDQVKQLRDAQLDVIFFGGDVTERTDALRRLAARRIAPLQVVQDRTGLTTGLPTIDLVISGNRPITTEVVAGFAERLGLTRGPVHAFSFPPINPANDPAEIRAEFGWLDGQVVFASVVTLGACNEATGLLWADVLGKSPEARLAVVLTDANEHDGLGAARFGRAVETVFAKAGVDTARVSLFPVATGQSGSVRAILGAADLFVAAQSGTDSVWVAAALALGVPVLALCEGVAQDLGAAAGMLESLGLTELIADTEESLGLTATALARDAGARDALRTRLQTAIEGGPLFLDTLAASDGLGALLETAFDELAALGRSAFRAEREPVLCYSADDSEEAVTAGLAAHAAGNTSTAAFEANAALRAAPANPRARRLRAEILLSEGRVARATDYLLAALPHFANDSGFWFLLAQALRCNGQSPQALQALESCLRIDGRHVDAWLLLAELADSVGASDFALEARQTLREISPDDYRVMALT